MTTVNLADRCVVVPLAPKLELTLPGGVKIAASAGLEKGTAAAAIRPFVATMSAATAFLGPFYVALETGTAAIAVLNSVPKILTQPQKVLEALAKLAEVVPKLLALAPQFSVPPLVKGILQTLAVALRAMHEELSAIVDQEQATNDAEALANELGLAQLQAAVECARGELQSSKANLAAGFGPINTLLGFVRAIVGLLPVPVNIPTLDAPGENAAEALDAIGVLATTLETIANGIPIPG